MKIKRLVEGYKDGNEDYLLKIIEECNHLIKRYSYIYGEMDEDLYNELLICLLKCVDKFKFNKEHFEEIYKCSDIFIK